MDGSGGTKNSSVEPVEAPSPKKGYSPHTGERSPRYCRVGWGDQSMSGDRLREEALVVLEKAKPENFVGHTEFYSMTPLERLRWLDQAVEMASKTPP